MNDVATAEQQVSTERKFPEPKAPATGGAVVAQPPAAPRAAMAVVRATPGGALRIQSSEEMWALAGFMAKSYAIPKTYAELGGKELPYENMRGNLFVGMQYGAEIGLPPMQSIQTIAIINGIPSLWGDGMMAVVRRSGLMGSFDEGIDKGKEDDPTTWTAWCESTRADTGEKKRETFSWADAVRANLAGKRGDMYKLYPQRMLPARARSWCLRGLYQDVLKGLASADEMLDAIDAGRGADGTWTTAPIGDRPTAAAAAIEGPKDQQAPAGSTAGATDSFGLYSHDGDLIETIGNAQSFKARLIGALKDNNLNPEQITAFVANNGQDIDRLDAEPAAEVYAAVEAAQEAATKPKPAPKPRAPKAAKAAAPEPEGDPRPEPHETAGATPAQSGAAAPSPALPPAAPASPAEKIITAADVPANERDFYVRTVARMDAAADASALRSMWGYAEKYTLPGMSDLARKGLAAEHARIAERHRKAAK